MLATMDWLLADTEALDLFRDAGKPVQRAVHGFYSLARAVRRGDAQLGDNLARLPLMPGAERSVQVPGLQATKAV